ncbi:MAG: alpha/beta hydrolase [Planctomycetaceae bacterium]|nr:alpha/beta hydrolase [Planctomycetaceae bacterium]
MSTPSLQPPASSSSKQPQKPKPLWRRRLLRAFLIYAVMPYAVITLLAFVFQRQLMYHPGRVDSLSVASVGLNTDTSEDVTIQTSDGETLKGWLLKYRKAAPDVSAATSATESQPPGQEPDQSGAAAVDSSQAAKPADESANRVLVIYFPGNAQNRFQRLADLKEIQSCGADVLIFDYRGFGDSTGSPTESDMEADARAVWKFAHDELGFADDQIILFGESLGGAVSLSLWSGDLSPAPKPRAVILNSTFASMPRMAAVTYPWFPFRWMVLDRWPSFERIANVTCPIIQFHGDSDELVPLSEAEFLQSCAKAETRFEVIKGGSHNGLPSLPLRRQLKRIITGQDPDADRKSFLIP